MKPLAIAVILALSISLLSTGSLVNCASANPKTPFPQLAMPVEYINYTITSINGTIWAKIDGNYPIYIQSDCPVESLPMVYPMPPNTTNIQVRLNDQELSWINYTQAYPGELHHTAIGDWWMIYTVLEPVTDFFELKIHYEHPLERVNGSYLFLYDLNISPYLTEQNNNSTAYFTIRLEVDVTNIEAYMTKTDLQWVPINYTLTNEDSAVVLNIEVISEYDNVPGDLVVVFSNADEPSELPRWVLPISVLIIVILSLLLAAYLKKKNC